jgi:hypothetical protein
MKKGLTELILILDRSGSMDSIWSDAVGGMKSFIQKQKEVPGDANLTLVLFDEPPFDTVYLRVPIREVDINRLDSFYPRNGTALLKAVSDTVDSIGQRLAAEREQDRPEHVMVIVQTDGEENSSNKGWSPVRFDEPWYKSWTNRWIKSQEPPYTKQKLQDKLKHQVDVYKWEVVFLGADINAFDEGAAIGATRSYQYNNTKGGTQALYSALSDSTTSYRGVGSFNEESDKLMKGLKDKK